MHTKIFIMGLTCLLLINCISIQLPKQRQEYIKTHPNLNSEIKEAILNGMVLLGMTREQVIASSGKPLDINASTGEWGVHEQWIYVGVEANARIQTSKKEWRLDQFYAYIYFENGKVTSWQSR